MFHRAFPETQASPSTIRRIYKFYGIKFKTIRRGKHSIDFDHPHHRELFIALNQSMQRAIAAQTKIVWLDEAVFSFNTYAKRAWYLKNKRLEIPEKRYQTKT